MTRISHTKVSDSPWKVLVFVNDYFQTTSSVWRHHHTLSIGGIAVDWRKTIQHSVVFVAEERGKSGVRETVRDSDVMVLS